MLALGLVLIIYMVLKHIRDEKTALIGTLLALFTPVGLAMLQREYMDGFARSVSE